jgi:hypothetical protein
MAGGDFSLELARFLFRSLPARLRRPNTAGGNPACERLPAAGRESLKARRPAAFERDIGRRLLMAAATFERSFDFAL